MTSRENKVINYFILLQVYSYKLDYIRNIYKKYGNLMGEKIEDCIFNFEKKDQKAFYKLSNDFKLKAYDCFNKFKNNILFYEDDLFPKRLKEIEEFPIAIFYKGNIKLLKEKSISIVGTRKPTDKTIYDTQRIAKYLTSRNITVVSGLAKGVDVTSHKCCIDMNYDNIIAVIGTPIDKYYPIENKDVQKYIEKNGLVISEYPDFEPTHKWNFLRRNYLMSAISEATIVMQAGDTSGTVSQARSTLKNGRPLFVPAYVFDDPANSWPHKFRIEFGRVYRFQYIEELKELLDNEI